MGRPLLDFKSVKSGRDNSQQPQIFQCSYSSRLSRSSPSFLFSRIISQGSARNSIFSQRSYPDSGGLEKGTPSAHSFINIYPHLNPHRGPKTSSPPVTAFLPPTRSSSHPPHFRGQSPPSPCICSCKSFIRSVRGFASITAVSDPNWLFHHGSVLFFHPISYFPSVPLSPLRLFSFSRSDAHKVLADTVSVS